MRVALPVFSLGLLLAATASAHERMKHPPDCTSDAQCVVTEFAGCCGGCCPSARVMAKAELGREQQRCAAMDCEAPMCAAMVCEAGPKADALLAKCVDRRCIAVPKEGSRPVECREDRECTVAYPAAAANAPCRSSRCGCCPGTIPFAEPVSKTERERPRPTPRSSPSPSHPPGYGLSQGKPEAPQVNCAACQAPQPARAVCRQNRCALDLPRQ